MTEQYYIKVFNEDKTIKKEVIPLTIKQNPLKRQNYK